MPSWMSLSFQDASSPVLLEFTKLHDHILVIMILVVILVSYILILLSFSSFFYKFMSEGTFIETIWSIIPAFLLVVLVVPSMKVLYLMEDVKLPSLSVKVVGHQWYWSYSVPTTSISEDALSKEFSDYHNYDSMLSVETPRLLSCEKDLVLPVFTSCRLLVSSSDVIHAFSVPSLGLKIDAVPGRVNQIFVYPYRQGFYFGQCSEICGSYHSFMPICVKVVDIVSYNSHTLSLSLDNILGSMPNK